MPGDAIRPQSRPAAKSLANPGMFSDTALFRIVGLPQDFAPERHHALTSPPPLDHPRRAHHQPVGDRHRQHGPERRAQDHRRAEASRARRHPEPARMGDQLLHAGVRRAPVHVRCDRGPGRAQAHAHDRPGRVRAVLAALRLHAQPGPAGVGHGSSRRCAHWCSYR